MKAAKIYIKSTGKEISLPASGDFPFRLSKAIADVKDVSKRDKTVSRTFKVPATPANIAALGYAHDMGSDLNTIPFKAPCYVMVGETVIEEGYLYLQKGVIGRHPKEFQCLFVGGNEEWVQGLTQFTMRDLGVTLNASGNLSPPVDAHVTYTDADIRAKMVTPGSTQGAHYTYVTPWPFLFNHRESIPNIPDSRNATYRDFWPAFRVDKLVEAMFAQVNFSASVFGTPYVNLSSSFFQDNATHGFWDEIYYSDRSAEYDVTFPDSNADWGEFLSDEETFLDFFMRLVRTFDLVLFWDGTTLTAEPRQDWTDWTDTTRTGFYSGAVDWSEKVTTEREVEYKLDYKRYFRLKWGKGSVPFDGSVYGWWEDETTSNPEAQYIVDTGGADEGYSDIELPFNVSPSVQFQPRFDYKFKQFDNPGLDFEIGTDSFSHRIFVYKWATPPHGSNITPVADPNQYWSGWRYEDDGGGTTDFSSVGYIYNCIQFDPFAAELGNLGGSYSIGVWQDEWDTPFNVDPTGYVFTDDGTTPPTKPADDINLGLYNPNLNGSVDGIYERFWQTTVQRLATTRLLTVGVRLTLNEFVDLDFRKYYEVDGHRFILNKIKDFDPTKPVQVVEAELLSVDGVDSSTLS